MAGGWGKDWNELWGVSADVVVVEPPPETATFDAFAEFSNLPLVRAKPRQRAAVVRLVGVESRGEVGIIHARGGARVTLTGVESRSSVGEIRARGIQNPTEEDLLFLLLHT